jgi:hypothetical protein
MFKSRSLTSKGSPVGSLILSAAAAMVTGFAVFAQQPKFCQCTQNKGDCSCRIVTGSQFCCCACGTKVGKCTLICEPSFTKCVSGPSVNGIGQASCVKGGGG